MGFPKQSKQEALKYLPAKEGMVPLDIVARKIKKPRE